MIFDFSSIKLHYL